MTEENVSIVLAIAIFVLTVPLLLWAKGTVRSKAARRFSSVAYALGLEELDPDGPQMLPLFEWESVLDPGSGHSVVSAIGGDYHEYQVILAEIVENADRSGSGSLRPPWKPRRPRRALRGLAGRMGSQGLADHLVIVFVERLPKLPNFRIEPRSTRNRATGSGPADWEPRDGNGPEDVLIISPIEARRALPEAFLDRAARVLIGRRASWAIEGAGDRLTVRVSGWRPRSNVRSYQAVLDDALSLREALTNFAVAPEAAEESRSIRTALERIRSASKDPVDPEGSDAIDS